MATPAQIRQQVDDALTTLGNAISNRQDTYAAAHNGKFWQGLRTHGTRPADGATSTPDVGTATPSDQVGNPWPAGIRSAALPMSIECHCYDGPQGTGYVVILEVVISGNTWRRVVNSGPETYRAQGWTQVS